jgi:peptidyl-prolyl cis-trans isomerase D
MLRSVRKASETWLGRIVMGVVMTLLAGVFAIWGINDIFHGYGSTAVAKVGGTEIPAQLFSQTYNEQLQELSRRAGRNITSEQAMALGLDRQVLSRLVAEAGLDQLAQRMRLGIPTAEIARQVMSDPHFQTPDGKFEHALFQNFLQNAGFSEQRYFQELQRSIPRRQITDSISGGIAVPQAFAKAINEFQNQQRGIQYLELGPAQAGDIAKPTDDTLKKYFEERKILFRAPEFRRIVSVALTPQDLAPTIQVSDADVKKYYDENISQYTTPERRHVQQIVFPTVAEAQAASVRIKGGMSFAALAAERGLKANDFDLGSVPKTGIVDPAVADAAFSLKSGEVSAPVQGRFGTVLVTVAGIEPGGTKPLSVMAPFIRSDIALQRAKSAVADVHDKVEDARAGGATLQEAAAKLKLHAVAVDADRSGRDPAGKPIACLPAAAEVISNAFNNDVGVDTYPIETGGGYVWYEVEGITPARDRTLAEVKSDVEQHWREDQISQRLKAKAADLVEKAKKGQAFDKLAAGAGVKVQTASGLKRGEAPPGVPGKVVEAAFHTAKGAFGSSDGERPTQWLVFQVTDVKTPAFDPNSDEGKKISGLLQASLRDDVFSQYVAWLEDYLGTTVNQSMLAQAVGGGGGGGGVPAGGGGGGLPETD